jgi:hypothetical protein
MTAHRPQALVSRACSAFFQLRPFYSGVCPEKHTSASEMISLVRERSTTHDADHEARPVRGHPGRRLRSGTLVLESWLWKRFTTLDGCTFTKAHYSKCSI